MPRTEIEIVTTGLADLQKATESLAAFEAKLISVKDAAAELGGVFRPFSQTMGGMGRSAETANVRLSELEKTIARLRAGAEGASGGFLKISTSTGEAGKRASGANRDFGGLLVTMLKYQAVSAVFSGISQSIGAAVQAAKDFDYQAARTTRITGGSRSQVASQLRLGTSLTGLDPKTAGEAYYQLGTFIQGAADQAKVFQNTMMLVNGTEGDARQTARASIQVYEDFADQLGGKNIPVAEKFRRANELIAISFKASNAEVDELSNALKYLAPTAQTAGVSVQQLFAVMTTLTSQGVRGRMEGTEAGSFVSRILKAYNDGVKGIEKGDKVYHFDFARDAKGGLDLIRTLEDIQRRYEALKRTNVTAAQEYITAIGGTQQAIRFLGGLSDETLGRMRSETVKNTQATNGLTHEVENLNREINNTASKQQARAWETFLGTLSGGLMEVYNALSRIQALHDLVHGMRADLENNAARELRANDLLGHGAMSPADQTRAKLAALQSALDIGSHIPTQWWNTNSNVNHTTGGISIEALRQNRRFQGTGAADLDAILQLLPNREAPLNPLEFGPGRHERYVLKDDLWSAIDKVQSDLRKMQFGAGASATAPHGSLSIHEMANVAIKAGFSRENLATAVAIAMAESGGDPRQVSQNHDRMHTHDRGLWQINSFWHQEVPDATAFDPEGNAAAAYRISGGGSDWRQWTTYRTGAYKRYLPQVLAALGTGGAGGGGGANGYSGPSITDKPEDPDKAAADRLRKQIEGLQDRIAMDRSKLRIVEAQFEDEEGLDAFKKMAAATDKIGADWKKAQLALAKLQHDPATLLLLTSGQGDFSDYGEWRGTAKGRMLKAGEQSAKDAAQERQDAADQRLQEFIDRLTEGAERAADRYAAARRPNLFGQDDDLAEMTMLTGQRSAHLTAGGSLATTILSRSMMGMPVSKELLDAYKEEAKSVRDLDTSIRDLTDAMLGKKITAGFQSLGQVLGVFNEQFQRLNDARDEPLAQAMAPLKGMLRSLGEADVRAGAKMNESSLYSRKAPELYQYGGARGGQPGSLGDISGGLEGIARLSETLFTHKDPTTGQMTMDPKSAAFAKYATAVGSGIGVIQQDFSQPLSLGGVVSSAQAGAGIGGMFGPGGALIGAAAGGVLGLIGGLFGGHHHVDNGSYDSNPALSNSPSDFDYLAYRYRTTGSTGLTGPQSRFFNTPGPTVNVYLDGVKQAVTTQISQQVSPSSASAVNVNYDATRPL
jgi:hypothetical protein